MMGTVGVTVVGRAMVKVGLAGIMTPSAVVVARVPVTTPRVDPAVTTIPQVALTTVVVAANAHVATVAEVAVKVTPVDTVPVAKVTAGVAAKVTVKDRARSATAALLLRAKVKVVVLVGPMVELEKVAVGE